MGRKLLFTFVTLVVATSVLVGLTELLLRFLQPTSKQYLALTPGTRVVFEPRFQPGVEGPSVYQVSSMGVRGREWSTNRSSEYRILAMGGSATECLMNDQERTWPALLERELDEGKDGRAVWVGNIGRSGLSSRHHVVQAEHLLETYDPDMVLLLVGVNDLASRLRAGDDYDPDFMSSQANLKELREVAFQVAPDETSAVRWKNDPWYKRTRFWGALRTVKYNWLNRSLEQDLEGRATESWREMRRSGARSSELPPLDDAIEEYRRNLGRIVARVRDYGAKPVFLTQPTLWCPDLTQEEEDLLWMGGVGEFRTERGSVYYTAGALAEAMDRYNEMLLSVCRQEAISCFDAASILPKTTVHFYDDCHFTDEGNRVLALALTQFLASEEPAVREPARQP